VRGTKRQSGDFTRNKHNEADRLRHRQTGVRQCCLVILRSLVQPAIKRRPDANWQRLDLLTRARDLLVEFYMEVKP